MESKGEIVIYQTQDGTTQLDVRLDGETVWMKNAINRSLWDKNQNQLAELFDTSVPNMSMHIANILKEGELDKNSVIKNYLTTASDGI